MVAGLMKRKFYLAIYAIRLSFTERKFMNVLVFIMFSILLLLIGILILDASQI